MGLAEKGKILTERLNLLFNDWEFVCKTSETPNLTSVEGKLPWYRDYHLEIKMFLFRGEKVYQVSFSKSHKHHYFARKTLEGDRVSLSNLIDACSILLITFVRERIGASMGFAKARRLLRTIKRNV